ncbi:MAG: M23 family metallopeptidase [Bdellovibrionales bacterium]|nr:M23 family metallopeptidase [Bdellovibrionales bacterium]
MKKTYTFLVTSNRKGETKSFTLSSSVLKLGFVVVVAAVVLISAMMIDYVGLLLQASENKRLKAQNTSLKRQFEVVETNVKDLENALERVKGFSQKLKLITDIDSNDRAIELDLGRKGKEDSSALNQDVSEFKTEGIKEGNDNQMLGSSPQDIKAGELLRLELNNYKTLSIRVRQDLKTTKLQEQGVLDLYNKLSQQSSVLKSTPTIKPAKGWYTAKFGYRNDPFSGKPVMHQGVEIAAPEGSPIVAPADGVVSYIGYDNNDGKVLTIDHGYGLKTTYSHNSQIFVEMGQKVKRKEMIAAVGSTGRSPSPHLYYEVRIHGVPVDPINFILEEE